MPRPAGLRWKYGLRTSTAKTCASCVQGSCRHLPRIFSRIMVVSQGRPCRGKNRFFVSTQPAPDRASEGPATSSPDCASPTCARHHQDLHSAISSQPVVNNSLLPLRFTTSSKWGRSPSRRMTVPSCSGTRPKTMALRRACSSRNSRQVVA